MKDTTATFFDELARRKHIPMLEKLTGTVRFDLAQDDRIDHFFVAINQGDVAVSDANSAADAVIETDRTLFDSIARGETNAMAAALRGALVFQGDQQLIVLVQRLFPAPPSSRSHGIETGSERVSS